MGGTKLLRDTLIGTWELVDYSMTSPEGEIHYPLGPEAQGLIMYTADGFMSAQLMTPDRRLFRSPSVHGGEVDELSAAASGYLAYSGPYRVDEDRQLVYHVVTMSLYPNWVGSDRTRHIRFDDENSLTLSSQPQSFRGTTWDPSVVWRRAATRMPSPPR